MNNTINIKNQAQSSLIFNNENVGDKNNQKNLNLKENLNQISFNINNSNNSYIICNKINQEASNNNTNLNNYTNNNMNGNPKSNKTTIKLNNKESENKNLNNNNNTNNNNINKQPIKSLHLNHTEKEKFFKALAFGHLNNQFSRTHQLISVESLYGIYYFY